MSDSPELPNDPGFARKVEQCETEAWLDLTPATDEARHLKFEQVSGATLLLDQATEWPHSRILSLGVERPVTPEAIDTMLAMTRQAGIRSLFAEVSPIARPGTVTRLLTRAGFEHTDRNVIVARATEQMGEPDSYFRLRTAGADDVPGMTDLMNRVIPGIPDWCALLASQAGRPNWRYFIALEDGLACGMVSCHLSGDMGWLSPAWVKQEFRNRGTQAALIAHAVREVEREGVKWVVTGYPASMTNRPRNYERLGFSIVYLRNRYTWTETDAAETDATGTEA